MCRTEVYLLQLHLSEIHTPSNSKLNKVDSLAILHTALTGVLQNQDVSCEVPSHGFQKLLMFHCNYQIKS